MVKKCLILGSANCLRHDLRRALSLAEFEGVVVCKGAGLAWSGRVDAWVSLHPDRIASDIARRRKYDWPDADRVYGHKEASGVTHVLPYKFDEQKTSGSSGLFALRVAMELGFDKFVLCGIPLLKEAGRLDGMERWRGAIAFRRGWEQVLPRIKDTTRSMSGWTKQLLGEPTAEWLNE